jgi:hypothetical protein
MMQRLLLCCLLACAASQLSTKNPNDLDGDRVPNRFDFCPFTSRGSTVMCCWHPNDRQPVEARV